MPASDSSSRPPSATKAKTLANPRTPPSAPPLPVLAKIINDIIELDPNYYFSKRYDDIVEAASELPVVIEYINESLQRAAIAAANSKRDVESLEAETYTRLRQEWNTAFAEKMTEKALEMAVAQDTDLTKASKNYSVLRSYVTRLANMQENLRSKLDLLRSVEATRRKLIEDEPPDRDR